MASRAAPGFHNHNEAHDAFLCTRGQMKLWAEDRYMILSPGDFAYVPPKAINQPQLVDAVIENVDFVTPGKWVDFFRFVTEKYDGIIGMSSIGTTRCRSMRSRRNMM